MKYRSVVLAVGMCLTASLSLATPSRSETAYVTPETSTVRVAAAEPKALEARSRSWLVSNAIKLYTTVAKGVAFFIR